MPHVTAGAFMSYRIARRSVFICVFILLLSLFCFVAAFILALVGKLSAVMFSGSGLVLALWGSAVASPAGVAARDVIALVRSRRVNRDRPPP